MVKSGLKNLEETEIVDKTPRVSPYRLTIHGGMAYGIYSITFYQALNLLRRPQEDFITLKNMRAHNKMRKSLMMSVHLLGLVYFTGFLTAGNWAGHACNTFPKIGEDWFLKKKHFNKDLGFFKNITENKLVVQVLHRTLACSMVALFTYQTYVLS